MRGLLGTRAVLIHLGGGDRRAIECNGATIAPLVALGIVDLFIAIGTGVLIGVCSINLFDLNGAWAGVAWCAGAAYGLITALVNRALMHSMFESYGMKQLNKLRARRAVPKLPGAAGRLLALRILIAIFLGAFIMVPVKLSLTQADQVAEIANEQNRRNLPLAKAALDSTNGTIDHLSQRNNAARRSIEGLIFEKSTIETAQLGSDALSIPAELAGRVRPEIPALAGRAAALARQEREQKAARDGELQLVRRLDQDISVLARQGRREAAAAADRRRTAAQQRASALARQIAITAGETADVRERLKVLGAAVELQLDQFQGQLTDDQARLDLIEKTRQQLIEHRVQASPGYQQVSSGFIGRIESLRRQWNSSPAARLAIAGLIALIAVLDLVPLLMKSATRLPAYALRIASDSQRAFAKEAAATVSADIQFVRLLNQLDAELDTIHKIQHQRSTERYRNYPPMAWIRLTAAFALFQRETLAEPEAVQRQSAIKQAA
jgi:hypothetical protein